MTSVVGVDTSVAIPLLVTTHTAHVAVVDWWAGRKIALSGHALVETFSVLTRLPGDVRLTPADAARLLVSRFASPLLLDPTDSAQLPTLFADLGVAGGSVYDAVIGLAAARNGCVLATRDARAKITYEAVGVEVDVVAAHA